MPGPGWGGPAKGAGKGGKAKPFTADSETRVTHSGPAAPLSDRKALKRLRSEQLEDMLFDIAQTTERDDTKISAITRLHAIWNGQPIAKNINVAKDDLAALSDDEINAELERISREEA